MEVADLESGFRITVFAQLPSGMSRVFQLESVLFFFLYILTPSQDSMPAISALSNRIVPGHRWLLSTCNVGSAK